MTVLLPHLLVTIHVVKTKLLFQIKGYKNLKINSINLIIMLRHGKQHSKGQF